MLIKLFLWLKPWKDIQVFNYGLQSYLLQGKRWKRTNVKVFKITQIGGHALSSLSVKTTKEELQKVNLFGDK